MRGKVSGQPWWTATDRAVVQAAHVTFGLVQLRRPYTDSQAADTPLAGDVCLGRLTSWQQPSGCQATCVTLHTRQMLGTLYYGALW